MVSLRFIGATHQVTGSSFLFTYQGQNILIDCGLFQERVPISQLGRVCISASRNKLRSSHSCPP